MRAFVLLLTALPSCACLYGQMATLNGTNMMLDAGTSLRIDTSLTWSIEAGASVVNDGSIILGPATELNEAPGAAITGAGTERTARTFTAPLIAADPAGLGGIITTNASLGATTVLRGHIPYTDYSGHTSIARWIDISPANNSGLNATLALRYEPAELNGIVEADQVLHIHAHDDIWWHLPSNVNIGQGTVTSSGLDSIGLFTTFEGDLPNSIHEDRTAAGFTLLGSPGTQLALQVPHGRIAHLAEVYGPLGTCHVSMTTNWTAGRHALPEFHLAPGVYYLRVNGSITLPFVQP